MLTIAIDCRMIKCSGIGTFLRGILPYLLLHRNMEFRLIGPVSQLSKYINSNVIIIPCKIPIFSWKEFLLFPRNKLKGCDIYFSPNYNIPGFLSIPVFSTIHDLLFFRYPIFKGVWGKNYS